MKSQRSTWRLAAWGLLLALVIVPGVAHGQEEKSKDPQYKADDPLDPKKKQLPVSLREAIVWALENNLDIRVDSYNPMINRESVIQARSVFDPVFFADTRFSESKTDTTPDPATSMTFPIRSDFSRTLALRYDFGIRKTTITGASYTLQWAVDRSRTKPKRAPSLDPRYAGRVELSATQPLLRNAGPTVNTTDILIAENTRDASVFNFQQTVIRVMTNVMLRYYDLVLARENLRVARVSLFQAEDLLRITKAKVEVGELRGLDKFGAESTVAQRNESLIVSANAVRDAEDTLKNLIRPLDDTLLNDTELIPTEVIPDEATIQKMEVRSLAGSIQHALAQRPEILAQRTTINSNHLSLLRARNAMLPKLDLTGSLAFTGDGNSHHRAVDEAGEFRYYDWSIGLVFEIPLGNRAARSAYRRSKLTYAQSQTSLQRLERNTIIDVRAQHRGVATARERIGAASAAYNAAKEEHEGQQARLEAGDRVTPFDVRQFLERRFQAENNLTSAKVNFIQALIRLRQADSSTMEELQRRKILVIDRAGEE